MALIKEATSQAGLSEIPEFALDDAGEWIPPVDPRTTHTHAGRARWEYRRDEGSYHVYGCTAAPDCPVTEIRVCSRYKEGQCICRS